MCPPEHQEVSLEVFSTEVPRKELLLPSANSHNRAKVLTEVCEVLVWLTWWLVFFRFLGVEGSLGSGASGFGELGVKSKKHVPNIYLSTNKMFKMTSVSFIA